MKLVDVALPNGLFARSTDSGVVKFIHDRKKHTASPSVLQSWGIGDSRGNQVARVFQGQLEELSSGAPLGFRPGSLVSPMGNDRVFFITNNGMNPGEGWWRGIKRELTTEFMTCLGFRQEQIIEVPGAALDANPTGSPIDDCTRHPNGTVLTNPEATDPTDPNPSVTPYWILDNNQKRPVSSEALSSWNMSLDAVTPTLDDVLLADGPQIGFRPGRLIRFDGSPIFFVTSSGDFPSGVKRPLQNAGAVTCYGMDKFEKQSVSREDAQVHSTGEDLPC